MNAISAGRQEDSELILEIWDTDFEVEEKPPGSRYGWICLCCLARYGRVRWITRGSGSFMCREHVGEYREWRKRQGLPPDSTPADTCRSSSVIRPSASLS